jgi:hypothetical protein
MSEDGLREIIEKVDLLTTEEQLRLIATLAERARVSTRVGSTPRRKWSDLRGLLSHPACGEDAQAYISRTRREADAKRLEKVNR